MGNQFRPEIAGLRAIAVMAVVLCHLKIPAFANGFVGVDIFFVISGYLISKHILSDIERGTFSFPRFYLKRFRRIIPALVTVVIATYLMGLLWLPPDLLRGMAKEGTHALLLIANIQYWREAKEYFATASEQLPLLHTWSLSVEEQFYLFWPAALLIAARWKIVGPAIAALAAISLALTLTVADRQAAFFLMPFRIFEFCIGAAAIYAKRLNFAQRNKQSISALGLAGILLSIATAQESGWPNLAAMLPCVGTAAVIAGGSGTLAASVISGRPFLWIGAVSYSLYLVHWPIVFFARFILGPDAMTPALMAALLVLTLVTAWALYEWVERPFRYGPDVPVRRALGRYAALIAGCVVITHLTYINNGFRWRLTPAQAELASLHAYGLKPCTDIADRHCAFGKVGAGTRIEIVGDSFSHQYVAAFDAILRRAGLQGETSMVGGCPILVGTLLVGERQTECRREAEKVFERVKASNADVVFGLSWKSYRDDNTISEFSRPDIPGGERRSVAQLQAALEATIAVMAKPRRKILPIGAQVETLCEIDKARLTPRPLPSAPNPACADRPVADVLKDGEAINAMLERVRAKSPHSVSLFRPVDFLCGQACPTIKDGVWLYHDSSHFTVAGGLYIGERAKDVF